MPTELTAIPTDLPAAPPRPSTGNARTAGRAAFALVAAVAGTEFLVLESASNGLGTAACLALLAVLSGIAAPIAPTRMQMKAAAAMQAAALMPMVEQFNPLTFLVAALGTFAVSLLLRGALTGDLGTRALEVAAQAVLAPIRSWTLGRQVASGTGGSVSAALRWLVPGAFALVFVVLFAQANPLVERFTDSVMRWTGSGSAMADKVFVWSLVAIAVAPFLAAVVPLAPRLSFALQAVTFLRPVGSDEARAAKAGRETAFALRCLALFNAVFAVQTLTDLAYLWGGLGLPDGMSYAAYAHRGAYPLLATAILAALFLVWTTRPRGPAEHSSLVAKLVLAWIAQNLLLLASSVLRLDLYVEAYGLTLWRISAFVWMGLVAVGFVLVLVRVLTGRSLGWLMIANAVVLAVTLHAVSFHDWSDTIARHNLARLEANPNAPLDILYLQRLGPAAYPAVRDFLMRTPLPEGDRAERLRRLEARLGHRVDLALSRCPETCADWRDWTRRKSRIIAARRAALTTPSARHDAAAEAVAVPEAVRETATIGRR